MKGKKTLFLAVLTLMMLVGLAATGTALAAPVHHPTPVAGILVRVGFSIETPQAHGNYVSQTEMATYLWSGDLEGIFAEYLTVYAPLTPNALNGLGPYTLAGTCTFDGTLQGQPISWVGHVVGGGYLDPAYPWPDTKGWESAVIAINGPGGVHSLVSGAIYAHGSWTPTSGSSTYRGLLTW